MRFVIVSDPPDRVRGGIERHAAALGAELVRRGHAARLVPPSELTRRDGADADWLVFDGIRRLAILRHARRGSSGPRLAAFPHGSFLEEVRTTELRAGGVWRPNLRFYGRVLFDRTVGRRVFGAIERWFALHEAEATDLERFLGVPRAHVTAIGPFVSPEFLAAAAGPTGVPRSGGPYLCSVARVERRKNFGPFLEAIADLPTRFLLAGQDRGGLADLERASRRVPGARWEYLGTVSEAEKVELMRGSQAVVVPSVSEGIPALALEALALGRPVILAGVAYGPDGPGVVRCAPDPASMRAAVESLATLGPVAPVPPLTVERAADRFLAALGA